MITTAIRTQNLGYPRIGGKRELKKATEAFWNGEISANELEQAGATIRRKNWEKQRDAGIDLIPCNDFSFYDQMLDLSCLLGNVPARFAWEKDAVDLELYFRMARGKQTPEFACEMTKWFDTNYHFIVPEFDEATTFKISSSKIFDEFAEAQEVGIQAKPVLIGPLTYLFLGKSIGTADTFDRFALFDQLLPAYVEILKRLEAAGAEWIQIDEPVLALDLDDCHRELLKTAFETFAREVPNLKVIATSYFGELRDNLETFLSLPVAGLHVDAVRGKSEVKTIVNGLHEDQVLSLGVVDGRNIWKTDLKQALHLIKGSVEKFGADRVFAAPSCSLLHVPVSLESETDLDDELLSWMAFADEKLGELSILREASQVDTSPAEILANESAIQCRRRSSRVSNPEVQARTASVREEMYHRSAPFSERQELQRKKLNLPVFPTTTIGSFPQISEVRQARAKFRKGIWTKEQYDTFLRLQTASCIEMQERAGLDMVVHGEFERNDMVEYFGEMLEGFAFTRYGWVQSYGTRCVKPPIIFGDVSRPEPMTVQWSEFAKSRTKLPMKGMLTGPVTILQWSFVRDDQLRKDTTLQIALAIRDEVCDLEAAGLAAVQIDEPAIREGLPLRKFDWKNYLDWAVKAFRLSAAGVRDETQIHTHMCYSEFNDIIESIAALDADVITIETARSNLELLGAFSDFAYPNEIGPGVYDIHSPRVPSIEEMEALLMKAAAVIPSRNLWVNPDCGLKTRDWPEVTAALTNMVEAARRVRESIEISDYAAVYSKVPAPKLATV
ncbi:UNVERIFIED_CONTAM: hypothetical protein GTU68_050197 [Idotea baltica]|nr:hypothetical protein [Idotea baltica]